MSRLVERLRVVIGGGVLWACAWAAIGFLLTIVVAMIAPDEVDPGEGPIDVAGILARAGFLAGILFGGLVAITETGTALAEVPRIRAVVWGLVASAAHPLLVDKPGRLLLACSLGAISALVSVAIARRRARRSPIANAAHSTTLVKTSH